MEAANPDRILPHIGSITLQDLTTLQYAEQQQQLLLQQGASNQVVAGGVGASNGSGARLTQVHCLHKLA